MQKWNIKPLCCSRCRSPFSYKVHNKYFSIVACVCREYPLLEGILYMYKEDLRKESLRVLRKGEYKRAERLLMAQRKRILTAISFLFNSNIVSKVSKLIFQKKFYQLLGFKGIISMLTFFSYPKPWAL